MSLVSWLLLSEYLFFKRQSDLLLELQDDYRAYVAAVNKVLHDYNKTKEKLDILNSLDVQNIEEKKKEIDFIGSGFYFCEFPEQAQVFSSDDQLDMESKESLLLVNRDYEYLKKSAFDYFEHLDDPSVFSRVDLDDWCDYTQQALSVKKDPPIINKKNSISRRRNRKVASYRGPQSAQKREKNEICFSWPLKRSEFWISSLFGPRRKPNGTCGFHYGIDMAAVRGIPIKAAASGIVVEARYSRGYGNTIVIAHNRKYRTRYAHLDKMFVRVGQKVKNQQLIGKVGRTGLVWKSQGRDPSHLHFEVHVFGKQANPLKFLA